MVEISSRVDPQGVMDLGLITRLRRLGGRGSEQTHWARTLTDATNEAESA